MKISTLKEIIIEFNENNIRYMITGGLAVIYYGYLRFTSDIDLIIDLEYNNLAKAIKVFLNLGYIPRIPVGFEELLDSNKYNKWIKEKNMIVFSIYNPKNIETPIDIFIQIPFNFDEEFQKKQIVEIAPYVEANIISYTQLINMKKQSNREIDRIDIINLEKTNG